MPRMRSAGTSTRSVPSFSTAAQSFRRAELVSISRGENYSFSISAKLAKAGARPTQPCTASAMPSPKEAMCKSSPIGDAPLGGSLGEVVAGRGRLVADPAPDDEDPAIETIEGAGDGARAPRPASLPPA
jgi:hypothetical protein